MPTVKIIEDFEFTGKVKEVFDEFKKVRETNKVPMYWRALATKPDYLKAYWDRYKSIMLTGKLDRKTKEIVAYAVAVTCAQHYAVERHTEALRRLGLDDEALVEICMVVDMFKGSTAIADGLLFEK